jgi:hypothetical protein
MLRYRYMNSTQLSSPNCLEDTEVQVHELYAAVFDDFLAESLDGHLCLAE